MKLPYEQDSAAIAAALEDYYFKGIYEGDLTKLSKIYHPGTLLFGDVQGVPYAKNLQEYLDGVAGRKSPKELGQDFKGEIIAIQVINSIAVAKVKVKMYTFLYEEFLSFHKIEGRWFLVNKMMTDTANQ
jgi:hypothetical protein